MTKAVSFLYPQHRLSVTDNLRSGAANSPDRTKFGIPFQGAEAQTVITISLGKPAAAAANNIALSQSVVGPGAGFVLNGATVVNGVAVLDFPRTVVGAWTTNSTVVVTGKDEYGQTMSESNGGGIATFTGKKAFKQITSISSSASITLATFGTGAILGLPYRPVIGGFVRGRLNEDTADAGTYVAPERTTSTTTTADVRGTYAPAGALNGANEYTVAFAAQNGPDDFFAYGIAQA